MEGRVEYRGGGGLDFQPSPLLLENGTNYSHLQRSIDTLRSLSDLRGDKNVDLRLNLHQDRLNHIDRNINSLELNLSLNTDRMHHDRLQQERLHQQERQQQQERMQQERIQQERLQHELQQERLHQERFQNDRIQQQQQQQERNMNIDRLINDRTMNDRLMDHSLSIDRLNLERSLQQPVMDRALTDRNLNNVDRLRNFDMQNNDISDIKYREYKAHLDSLRNNDNSRNNDAGNNRNSQNNEEERTTSSTPPTPLSVGENFQEEKVFGSKAELQLHTQAHMREAKPYKCSQCCKAFANSSYLSQHTRIHLGIKPYRCEICQRKFTQLSHLQQHIRTHTGDKPYKCRHPGCQKAFSQLSNLQSHSRCHQTDKPYKCNSCYKCFSDEPSLLEHIPKHKESKHLKTHICQYCGKSYTQETYLSKHMQKHAERTDKRPPITSLGLNHRGLEHPYWPKVSPDSAENMHEYPGEIPRNILDQTDDLVIIRQQLGQNPPAPPSTPNANLGNAYDTAISKSTTNSAFTPINAMSGHLNLNHHQLAPNRPYIYDPLSFQKQNSLDLQKSQPSNGFPNQLISLHQIRNYQPNTSLIEHGLLGLKDK